MLPCWWAATDDGMPRTRGSRPSTTGPLSASSPSVSSTRHHDSSCPRSKLEVLFHTLHTSVGAQRRRRSLEAKCPSGLETGFGVRALFSYSRLAPVAHAQSLRLTTGRTIITLKYEQDLKSVSWESLARNNDNCFCLLSGCRMSADAVDVLDSRCVATSPRSTSAGVRGDFN
jgi:hypothetical protein